jgi:23S rRNA pseudouridine1911/1915/1917 synthase
VSSKIEVPVPAQWQGQRLDVFLTRMIESVPSRSFAAKLILAGAVTVDGKVRKPSFCLEAQAYVVLNSEILNPVEEKVPQAEQIPLEILYEDKHVLVICKPAGLVVHPGAGVHSGTLVNAVLGHCKSELPSLGSSVRAGIVHRLDRDTSGVMVVAKTSQALTQLSQQFAEHTQTRIYHALVYGNLEPKQNRLVTGYGRDPKNRIKYTVLPEGQGKRAILNYEVQDTLCGEFFSLVKCSLYTGRTHQIRVQMSSLGYGIVGDMLYATPPEALRRQKSLWAYIQKNVQRQMLHAISLGFTHPATGERFTFTHPEPDDFYQLLKHLRNVVL